MSTHEEVAALRAEVALLRKGVRSLAVLTLAALFAALLLGARGWLFRPAGEEMRAVEVSAQEYRLLDPDGNLRGMWRCPPAGPSLIILDEKGRLAVELGQAPRGGGKIRLLDGAGRVLFERP